MFLEQKKDVKDVLTMKILLAKAKDVRKVAKIVKDVFDNENCQNKSC